MFTGSNEALQNYFEVRPVLISEFFSEWEAFLEYLNEDNRARLLTFLQLDSIKDVSPSYYRELPDQAKRFFADFLDEYGYSREHAHENPMNAPAWMLLQPVHDELMPVSEVVHFTDNADAILREGFRIGVPDADRIALTWMNDIWGNRTRAAGSKGPGYNAGYLASDYRPHPHHQRYGKEAVIFKTSGMLCHHIGDREEQMFFWGPDVQIESIKKFPLWDDPRI